LNSDGSPNPLTGAYYWVPILPLRSLGWRVLTCHDVGEDDDQSHFEIWPRVITHLSEIWGRDPKAMKRHMEKHCYGLPRGRVTHPVSVYLILHGDDSPIPDWTEAVVQAFGLHGRRFKPLFDEHEQRLPGDVLPLARVLGLFPALTDLKPSHQTQDRRTGRHPGVLGDGIGLPDNSDPPTCGTPPTGRGET
jgi:hypothetical protein